MTPAAPRLGDARATRVREPAAIDPIMLPKRQWLGWPIEVAILRARVEALRPVAISIAAAIECALVAARDHDGGGSQVRRKDDYHATDHD